MKSFQIKDLTVILNKQTIDVNQQFCHFGCTVFYSPLCHVGCSFVSPVCQFGCTHFQTPIVCHHGCTFRLPSLIPTPTILKDLTTPIEVELPNFKRSELEQLRAGIAELQTKVETQLRQAPDDLEELEGKLKEALEEVARQRQNPNR